MHRSVVVVRRDLLGISAEVTVDSPRPPSPPSPSPPPERDDETPVCFASQKTLKRHRETVHRQSGGFSCRVCDRHFYRRDQLKRHHISKHADEECEAPASYRCPVCQKSFHYRGHLREHLKTQPATTSSPPTSPVKPLAPPASGLRTDARTCPAELPDSVSEDCRQCSRDNWSQIRSHQQCGKRVQVHTW